MRGESLAGHWRRRSFYEWIKHSIEVGVIILTSPITLALIILLGIFVVLESRGGAFYCQTRVGLNGKPFTIYKLRSMRADAEKNGACWAEQQDYRVTRVGKFIRKTRIDELPQLLNVLKGDMSIIGPRPERPEFCFTFERDIPQFTDRLTVKPGLTGWAQINGGYDLSPKEKLEFDLYYIRHRGPWLDLRILALTVMIVLTGNGAR
ncbi:sugar transferase [Indiicoccus explosivorum]|uniref:sugar transferase n=1 Tax=Indiicoccus explosivorum TaxID=1917864 RepID=UPI003B9846F8